MEPAAPALLELQRALRASFLSYGDGEISVHVVDAGIGAGERLDIYRNTFASVLTNALRLSYPAVHRLVGADFFQGAARIFIARHLPTGACLDDYGGAFPAFLSGFEPASSLTYLPDVARLEWAVNRALHAADTDALDARRLAALGDAERARVRLLPHPSLGLIHARCPVDAVWRAVLDEDDAALSTINLGDGPVWLLVQRLATGIDLRRMSESAWRFTAALCAAASLVDALGEAPDLDAAELLSEHLAAGRFAGFHLNERPAP